MNLSRQHLFILLLVIYYASCMSLMTACLLCSQYEAKKRVSASDAMRHPYFRSMGPGVHKLPDGKSATLALLSLSTIYCLIDVAPSCQTPCREMHLMGCDCKISSSLNHEPQQRNILRFSMYFQVINTFIDRFEVPLKQCLSGKKTCQVFYIRHSVHDRFYILSTRNLLNEFCVKEANL